MSAVNERSLSEISEQETLIRFSVDLVAAARRNLGFLRLVNDCLWLHNDSSIVEAIRRYDQVWMPLVADLATGTNSKPPMILPPLDVEWVWFCHTLNPASYRNYCESRFSKLIGRPVIFDDENEDYALNRCREIWELKYPSEPFENETETGGGSRCYSSSLSEDLLDQVVKQRNLCTIMSKPYYWEIVYLMAAKQRYKGFVYMIHRFGVECSCFVPTSDVLLMWLTHKSYPTVYATDTKDLECELEKIVWTCQAAKDEYTRATKNLWEKTFDQPYEKAGCPSISRHLVDEPLYWDVTDTDVNTRYKSLVPRFLFEVCIYVKLKSNTKGTKSDLSREFLCIRIVKRHRELKVEKLLSDFTTDSWQKVLHLYCEFGTKGMLFELGRRGNTRCFKGSTPQESVSLPWNELLRAPSLTSGKEIDGRVRIMASITPPVQASYLLKCVPDRVTDDSGAMISDVILKMNQYRPQEGRWLSRTVLDHAGRDCFVIRMRVGGGIWRRGGEVPRAVKWEGRIIEIREGSWSYVTGSCSIGRSPEKVVGTATPKQPHEGYQSSWSFSNEYELSIKWESSTSLSGFRFDLESTTSAESTVKLLPGRHMQYQAKKFGSDAKDRKENKNMEEGSSSTEEDDFVTMIRFSDEIPNGKATALLNWKLLVVDVLPEEDTVFVLLICISILRTASEMKREDVGGLLIRRRVREAKAGDRDWGSVILHPSSYSPSISSPHLHPWHWNSKMVMSSQVKDQIATAPSLNYSQAEGGDKLYRSGIIMP